MNLSPSNEEAADIFRVILHEALVMHPTWRELRRLIREIRQDYDRGEFKGKNGQLRLKLRINHLENIAVEMQD